MSDFLSSLAARSLGLAEVVRPRVASLFEPAAADAPNARSLGGSFDNEDGVPGARSTVALEAAHAGEGASASPPRHDRRGGEDADAVEAAASEQTEPASGEDRAAHRLERAVAPAMRVHAPTRLPPPVLPHPSDGHAMHRTTEGSSDMHAAQRLDGARRTETLPTRAESESRRPANEDADASRHVGQPAASRRPAVEPGGERHAPTAIAAPSRQRNELISVAPPTLVVRPYQPDAIRRSGQDAFALNRTDVPSEGVIAPTVGKLESARPKPDDRPGHLERGSSELSGSERVEPLDPVTAISARVVAQPRVGLYAEPAAPTRPGAASMPEPTIQVTIGRVEVRATQPAASARPRERHSLPVMSLEEYLRRRAEGNAR